jgi:hypothetical protein
VYYFIKEISSDGDVSTVDVIYPAAPFFLYFNPELLRQLMVIIAPVSLCLPVPLALATITHSQRLSLSSSIDPCDVIW